MGTNFEHNFNYDLLMVHVFKATINQSYCKYNTSLRQPQDLVWLPMDYYGFSSQAISLLQSREVKLKH